MKCVEIEKLLDEFVGDELDFAVRQKVDLHLRVCIDCRNEAEKLQDTARLLKSIPLIAPSKQFDARMMQAFQQHHETENRPNFWTAVFANFSISKSALAFGTLILVAFAGLAFQLGRIYAPNAQISQNPPVVQITPKAQPDQVVKIVEKLVEVPVYKEKIVERIIYRTRENVKPTYQQQNSSINLQSAYAKKQDTEPIEPLTLKDFRPVSELNIQTVARSGNNEK